MKIIDAFTFFNAVDVLKMRLRLHYNYVDAFYICEADRTYSGLPKTYIFEQYKHEFETWADKIHYIKYEAKIDGLDFSIKDKEQNLNFDSPAWIMEFNQRNELKEHIECDDGDLVIITDMDEFIDPKVLVYLRHNDHQRQWDEARLNMSFHHYYMNCIQPGKIWTHPFMAIGSRFKELGNISRHRHLAGMKFFFPDAGWHFSGLGGIDALLEKIVSTSHTELALAGVNDADYLRECIRFGVLPTPKKQEPNLRNCELGFLPLSVFPEYLQEIMRDNPKYIVTDLSK